MQTENDLSPTQNAVTVGDAATAHPIPIRQLQSTLEMFADRMALRFAGVTALLTGALAWMLNLGSNPIPFAGIGGFAILIFYFSVIIAFGAAATGFALGVRTRNTLVEPDLQRSWKLPAIPLALAYALVTALLVRIALQFVDIAFQDLALPSVYAVLVVGMVCGLVTYKVADHAAQSSMRSVLSIFAIILLAGVSISAIDENNPLWWKESFSFLGESHSTDRFVFNGTLILSGILFIILQQFFMDQFARLRAMGLLSATKTRLVRFSLIGIGVALVLVGLVPFGVNDLMNSLHSGAAYALIVILLAHMIFARRLLPFFPREFYAVTWLMVGATIVALALHLLGSINTVGIELVGFIIAGAWFMMFAKNVELLVYRTEISPDSLEQESHHA